jgi:hypothetical protein
MAYTKYSLTPANNNAAPPDGAPEGMLPSAVNDTMRDMMAQIRDVGDGIRGGTYTMTAPVITGGSINGTTVGAGTASTGAFTTLGATGVATFSAGSVSAPAITTTGDTNTGIFFPAADTIAFTEGGVESMRIDSSGKALIGITTAVGSPIFQVNGDAAVLNGNKLYLWNTGNSNAPYIANAGGSAIAIYDTSSNQRVIIDNSGNVGIATSSPTKQLSIGSGATSTLGFTWTGDQLTKAGIEANHGTGEVRYGAVANYFPTFYSNNTERMRIESNGNLLVGTTTAQGLVTVTQNANQPTAHINNLNASFSDTSVIVYTSRTTTNSSFNQLACYNGNFSGQFLIRDSGNAVNTNNSYGSTSDIKLKENIVDATPKLKDLCKVKVRQYTLKNDENKLKQIGVVAQELEEVFAGLVEETFDKDMKGNNLGTTTKSVKYSVFVPMLIKAMQEQQAMIETLTTRLNALEGK